MSLQHHQFVMFSLQCRFPNHDCPFCTKKYVRSREGKKGCRPPSPPPPQLVGQQCLLAAFRRERLFQTFLGLKQTFNILHIFLKKVEQSVDGIFFTPLGIIHYLFQKISSLTVLVACQEFRETEDQSAVAYYKQIRHRYLLST